MLAIPDKNCEQWKFLIKLIFKLIFERFVKALFEQWFCKFGIPAQIHTDGGKEFVNKLLAELCELLNIQHSKTTPYHPQCNAQVEVFNKTVKKYLASYVD
jgi:transposase InsO family protein